MNSEPLRRSYLHALGVPVWGRRVVALGVQSRSPDAVAAAWSLLKHSESPRLAFLLQASPNGAEEALLERITLALGLGSEDTQWWLAVGDAGSAVEMTTPVVTFGGQFTFDAAVPVVSAPPLGVLIAEPHHKAALWAELQARILPHLS